MKAVIQCGGKGTRLLPHTSILPKPLMPIGSRPVLELVLKWLRRNGIKEVFITTGYLGHLIRSVCGDGSQWNMRITYTQEMEPLGTIGPLSLVREHLDEPFLVLNGDVLTDLNLNQLVSCHRRHQGALTIATASRPTKMDFGVIEEAEGRVTEFREKPELSHLVSMGIYCMDPTVLDRIPVGRPVRIRRSDVPDDRGGGVCERIQAPRHVARYRAGGGFPQGAGCPMGRAIACIRGRQSCLRQCCRLR